MIADPQIASWRRSDMFGAWKIIFLLYRRPKCYLEQFEKSKKNVALMDGIFIYLWTLPVMIFVCLCGGGVLMLLDLRIANASIYYLLAFSVVGICFGGVFSVFFGWVFGKSYGVTNGIMFGVFSGVVVGTGLGLFGVITLGVIYSSVDSITIGIAKGTVLGVVMGMLGTSLAGVFKESAIGAIFAIIFAKYIGLMAVISVAVAFQVAEGVAAISPYSATYGFTATILGGIVLTRSYYNIFVLPFGFLFRRFSLYSLHPVVWDDMCGIPFFGLHQLLINEWVKDAAKGNKEIERILNYPTQRAEGLKALTIIILRGMAGSPLSQLGEHAGTLPEGEKGYLRQTPRVREQCAEIAHQTKLLVSANRAYMRSAHYELLVEKIKSFKHQVRGFEYPLALECEKAADAWLLAAEQLRPLSTNRHETVPGVFRAGDPVDADSEAFVHRLKVFGNLERQLTLATGCPGLVLYGRRRVGKSTLLRNLPQFLTDNFITLTLSMQDPKFFTDLASFVRSLREEALRQCPADIAQLSPDQPETLPGLIQSLASWNQQLGEKRRLLLCIDEYEMIDQKMAEGVFTENLLDTIRQSIQTHRRITWLFAGSHRIEELGAADWTSRLVSAATLTLGCFTLEETRLLLSDPLGRSHFWSQRADKPNLANFWAEGHIEQIQAETGGWPHLVQLLAQTLVDQANDRGQTKTDPELFADALEEAADSGHNVFYQLLIRESSEAQQTYLRGFVNQQTQPIPEDPELNRSLKRSDLVFATETGYQLKAPIMARWMRRHLD